MKQCKSAGLLASLPPALALVAALVFVPSHSRGQTIPNPSFELDNFAVGSGYISENSPITGWTGSPAGQVGLNPAGAQSPLANNGAIPSGARVAFLQSASGSPATLSTVITDLTPGVKYTVNFRLNARTNSPAQTAFLKIGVDNKPIVNMSTIGVQIGGTSTPYRYAAFDFTAANTTATLSLTNDATTDTTALVDDFSIHVATNGWSYAAWTGDADSGVDSARTTHAFNFGGNAAPDTTINGVVFKGIVGANAIAPNEFSMTGLASAYTSDDANNVTTGGSAAVAKRFIYGGNPGTFFITDLVPGVEYVANFYTMAWETGMRAQTLACGNDMLTVNQDHFDNNNGIRISYRYIAPASGCITLTQTPLLPASTMHLYGFANWEVNPQPLPVVGQPRSQVSTPGSMVTFSVAGGGARPLYFQWLKDGAVLAGQTNRFLTLTNVTAADLGGYAAMVTNANGSVTSQVATLTFGLIANPSFEADAFHTWPGYVSVDKPISGWVADIPSRAGINPMPNYAGPFANTGAIPDGNQVGFLQSTGTLSTIMNGLTPGQKYTLSFRASARNGQVPTLHATVDDQSILDCRVGSAAGTSVYRYIAFDFTPATASPTLYLTNDTVGDHTALLDDFRVAPSTTHWSFSSWADDASSGVDPSRNYSHAYNFGTSSDAIIDGVLFKAAPGANPSGRGFVTAGFPSIYTGDANNITAAGGGSAAMMRDFIYGSVPESITLTGLVPYVEYAATIYSVGWADTGGKAYGRAATFTVGTDRQTINQDFYGTDVGIKMTYRYVADASGSIVLTMDPTHNAGGSLTTIHTYGFSNCEVNSTNAPCFYQQPQGRTISGGANVTFYTAVGGALPISLQWRKDGVDLPGETGLTLNLLNVDGSATGDYTLVASNPVGVVTSAVARLEVGLAMVNPSFEVDTFNTYPGYIDANGPITGWTASLSFQTGLNPAAGSPFANNGVIPDGSQVAFIQADGGTLSQVVNGLIVGRTYYLKFFENSRSGYNAPTLAVTFGGTEIVPAHTVPSGAYNRVVSGPFQATTDSAELVFTKTPGPAGGDSTVLIDAVAVLELPPTPPTFVTQPQSIYLKQGDAATLYGIVQGSLPMTLQWQREQMDITDATNATLPFPALQLSDTGNYRLIAINAYGSATSQVAVVRVGLGIPQLFGTGLDQNGALLSGGTVDPHYQLIYSDDPFAPGPNAWIMLDQYPVDGTHYMKNGPYSAWIAPRVNEINYVRTLPGTYTYRTTFLLDTLDPATAQIQGKWAMDNYGTDVLLNGVSLGITNGVGFTSFGAFTITNGFVAGLNTLDFVVSNSPPADLTALRVELSGLAQPLPPAAPRITTQPTDQMQTESQAATFSVAAVGNPLFYQWYYEGSALPGQTDRVLLLSPVTVSSAGHYYVVVNNSMGSVTSSNALLVVNRAPVAADDFIATAQDQPVSIPVGRLLVNDSDPDNDALFVQGADANSGAGGTVVVGGGAVTYTPPTGYIGPDQFVYRIRDSRGGVASGMVNVTVGATNFLTVVSAPAYTFGRFHMIYSGVPGYPYAVQYSTAATGPWTILTNAVADPNGLFEINDTIAPPAPATRFYRISYP